MDGDLDNRYSTLLQHNRLVLSLLNQVVHGHDQARASLLTVKFCRIVRVAHGLGTIQVVKWSKKYVFYSPKTSFFIIRHTLCGTRGLANVV